MSMLKLAYGLSSKHFSSTPGCAHHMEAKSRMETGVYCATPQISRDSATAEKNQYPIMTRPFVQAAIPYALVIFRLSKIG